MLSAEVEMPCAAHQFKHARRACGRVLCFECYRRRAKSASAAEPMTPPFLRALSTKEVEHRRVMLENLQRAER
jgi:hypothetical protein